MLERLSIQATVLLVAILLLLGGAAIFRSGQRAGPNVTLDPIAAQRSGTPSTGTNRSSMRASLRFVLRNRGDASARGVRLRILAAPVGQPERLRLVRDFTFANELEMGTALVHSLSLEESPVRQDASGRLLPRLRFVIVALADYQDAAAWWDDDERKRWYYRYDMGDEYAMPAALQLKNALDPYIEKALSAKPNASQSGEGGALRGGAAPPSPAPSAEPAPPATEQ